MPDFVDEDLYRRVEQLLQPGDVELNGLVVHTDLGSDEESRMHQLTIEVGDVIAAHATDADTYVYSGNDDPEFGMNQHQGLTIADDAFVWECQQLLREETYDLVFYYEASADHEAILDDLDDRGYDVVGVEG
ncbi:MAG: DUF5778 family protein [Haloarculaceae archaeon]